MAQKLHLFKKANLKILHLLHQGVAWAADNEEEIILLLLYGSYLVDMAFNLAPSGDKHDFFPFFDGYGNWDGTMSTQNYVYKFCGFVSRMMIIGAFWIAVKKPQIAVVFWIEFVDLVDFCLCYNYRWFFVGWYSVEYNDVTFVLIAILILQTWIPSRQLS